MTRDEAVTLILNRSGQRGGTGSPVDTGLQTQVITEMKFQQEELEKGELGLMPWFLRQEYTDAAFKTAAGMAMVTVPPGFLREWEEARVALFYQDTTLDDDWVPIPKVDYDEGKNEFGGDVPGKPQAYTLMGLVYRFWPVPDAVYSLKALIYVGDTVLSTNVENSWLKYAGKLLIGKTGQMVAGPLLRDDAAKKFFDDMAAQGAAALVRDNAARDEAGRARSQGEE